MKARWSWCIIALMALAMLTTVPPAPAVAEGCSGQSDTIPSTLKGSPVVYVHGWLGSNNDVGTIDPQILLIKFLGGNYPVLGFDYGSSNTTWAADPSISRCLADFIEKAAQASQAGGGSGKVVAVAHSMGGIGVRAASAQLVSDGRGTSLAGLVTIGTPHRGSPLAGGYATIAEWGKGKPSIPFLEPGNAASKCLAWPRPTTCTDVPYLANGEEIATIAGQIQVTDSLFDLPVFPTSSYKIGDSIVLESSANGYAGSSSGHPPSGSVLGSDTVSCNVTSSQINKKLSIFGFGGLGVGTDALSLELMEEGAGSPQMGAAVGVLDGMTKCAHGQLPKNGDVIALVSKYVHEMAPIAASTAGQPSGGSSDQTPADRSSAQAGSATPAPTPGWISANDVQIVNSGNGEDWKKQITIKTTTFNGGYEGWYDTGKYYGDPDKLSWAVKGLCTKFEVYVGADATSSGTLGTTKFTVWADDRVVATAVKSYLDPPDKIDVDLTGATRLTIQDDRTNLGGAYAAWAEPRFYCSQNPAPKQ